MDAAVDMLLMVCTVPLNGRQIQFLTETDIAGTWRSGVRVKGRLTAVNLSKEISQGNWLNV